MCKRNKRITYKIKSIFFLYKLIYYIPYQRVTYIIKFILIKLYIMYLPYKYIITYPPCIQVQYIGRQVPIYILIFLVRTYLPTLFLPERYSPFWSLSLSLVLSRSLSFSLCVIRIHYLLFSAYLFHCYLYSVLND